MALGLKPAFNIFIKNYSMTKSKKIESSPPRRQAIIVLGMHRSGTSALAGLLTKLGANGPSMLLGPSKNNPVGHFESRSLYLMQDNLLDSAGTSWFDYRKFPSSWYASPKFLEYKKNIKSILESEYGSSELFVVKDPRNCRIVSFWNSVLDELNADPFFLHTHRNPLDVAKSLNRRDGFDIEYGCLLWLRHILDAEFGSRGHTRSFTSYDRILENWPSEIEKISRDFNIDWPNYKSANLVELGGMIRPDLRRNESSSIINSKVFAQWFRDVLEIFNRWAADGEMTEDYLLLDKIRHSFDDSAEVFGAAVHAKGRSLATERDEALQKAEAIQKIADKALLDRDNGNSRIAKLHSDLEAMTAERDQLMSQLHLTHSMLDQRKAELDDTRDDLDKARAALARAVEDAEVLTRDFDSAQQKIHALQAVETRRSYEFAKVQRALLSHQDRITGEDKAKQDQAAKLAVTVTNLKDRLAKSDARVHALEASNSWKITAPLRWIVERFKR